ncbi:MAG: hypothetical protein Kow00108_02170 [Calditrichia bacterium]
MEHVTLKKAPVLAPNLPFTAKKIFSKSAVELVYLELEPGQKLDPHSVDFTATFFVLSGNGFLLTGEETIPVESEEVFRFAPEEKRGWENTGKEPLRLLVWKEFE